MTADAMPLTGIVERSEVHFDDFDPMGIVHNVKYGLLVERAMSRFWLRQGWSFDSALSKAGRGSFLAVREFTITFHAPIRATGAVDVHFWIEKLGTSSVVYRFRILAEDHTVVHAEGTRVQVAVDPDTGRPTPISETLREMARPLLPE